MKTYTASEARARFGSFLDDAQRQPVHVTRHGQPVAVMLGPRDFENVRVFYAHRLQEAMKRAAEQAANTGLTAGKLEDLLADES